ncbi:unnamed protein product, partial [Heterosigma akashiwo]
MSISKVIFILFSLFFCFQKASAIETGNGKEDFLVEFNMQLSDTESGSIMFKIHPSWAPKGADRFHELVSENFFTDVRFFRVISGFMAQFGISGDPSISSVWRDKRITDDPWRPAQASAAAPSASRRPARTRAPPSSSSTSGITHFWILKDSPPLEKLLQWTRRWCPTWSPCAPAWPPSRPRRRGTTTPSWPRAGARQTRAPRSGSSTPLRARAAGDPVPGPCRLVPLLRKVWLQLEEKRIPYEVKKVPLRCYGDKPQWFRAVSPGGMLPVAEIDGQIISESNDIMQALEDVFPENNPLIPEADAEGRHKFNSLLRLERELFSVWFRWLTSPGRDAPQRAQFKEVMGRVNGALAASGGPYFLGGELTLVDVMFTPFLERMAASLLYFKALDLRNNPDWPALEAWYQAMDQRPAYQGIKSDYYTHCHDLPPQIGGSFAVDEAKPYADAIDGLDGESW